MVHHSASVSGTRQHVDPDVCCPQIGDAVVAKMHQTGSISTSLRHKANAEMGSISVYGPGKLEILLRTLSAYIPCRLTSCRVLPWWASWITWPRGSGAGVDVRTFH